VEAIIADCKATESTPESIILKMFVKDTGACKTDVEGTVDTFLDLIGAIKA